MGDAFLFNHSKSKVKAPTIILGVKIHPTSYTSSASFESDPNYVEYIDGLEGCTPAYWSNNSNNSPAVVTHDQEIFQKIRQVCNFRYCHISTTANASSFNPKYLRDDDWTKYEDGNSAVANMTNGSYNTLTEFPHFYLSVTKDSAGFMYVRISNHKVDDTYSDWMFSYKGEVYSAKYLGSFMGAVMGGTLRSVAAATPSNDSPYNLTVYARNNYRGDLLNYGSWVILQVLYLLAFCSLHSRNTISYGYIGGGDGISLSSPAVTGADYTKAVGGMYRTGYKYRASRFRLFGIEDAWGSKLQVCLNLKSVYDGGYRLSLSDYTLLNGAHVDSSNGVDYTLATLPITPCRLEFIYNFEGSTMFPFVPSPQRGNTMFFTGEKNNYESSSGRMISVGGYYGSGKSSGIFRNPTNSSFHSSGPERGSRLVLIHPEPYVE